MPGPDGRAGVPRDHRDQVWAAAVLRTHGDLCHVCGHGGARQSDHLVDPGTRPDLRFAVSNGRPSHGAARGRGANPCTVCSRAAGRPVYCNQLRGMGSVERARNKIRELTGLPMPGDSGGAAPDPRNAGRDW